MKLALVLSLAALLVALPAAPASAQQPVTGVRIMVAAADSDQLSVLRSSDIYHRLQLPLHEEMSRADYNALYEDAIAAELGWVIEDRSSKQKSIDLAKTACTSNKATLCARVLILVKTRATALDLGFGTRAEVRMTGEMIDVSTNRFLGGWEAEPLRFPAPKACNNVCLENVVGDNARKVALNLADTLRKMLDSQAVRTASTAAGAAVTGRGSRGGAGLANNFVLAFEHFQMQELLPLKSIVEHEFTDTIEVNTPEGGAGSFSFNLATRASADKILEMLHLMMEDRGYDLSKIKITVSGDRFVIDRIVDDGFRPRPKGLHRR